MKSTACAVLLLIFFGQTLSVWGQADQKAKDQKKQNGPLDPQAVERCCAAVKKLNFRSSLPIIVLNTDGNNVYATSKSNATLCSCGGQDGEDYAGPIMMRIRGSSSSRDGKKSFAVDFRMNNGSKVASKFLGLPKDDVWVFYGPESDYAMGMRNKLTYDMFRKMGRWASHTQYAEVFLVGDGSAVTMDDYYGLFLITQKIGRDKHKIDIKALKEDSKDVTGGYIIRYENDNIDPGDVIFGPLKLSQLTMLADYPSKPTPQELQYITGFMNSLEYALATDGNWTSYIDVGSAIDYFIMTEITKNPDGYRGSIYMFKDKDGPLHFGPPWDYNEAYGLCCGFPIEGYKQGGVSTGSSGGSAISPQGWRFNICNDRTRCLADPTDGISQYYRRMWTNATFRHQAATRWATLRNGNFSDKAFISKIDEMNQTIYSAAMRNYNKWYATALKEPSYTGPVAQYNGEVQKLKTWLVEHLKWLDTAFAQADSQQTKAQPTAG